MEALKLLVELKLGIDPATSALMNENINAHWLPDESDILCMTKYTGNITDDLWNPDGEYLELDQAGSVSEYWELGGSNILQLK